MKDSSDAPILLLGYNRPEHLTGLIDCLRSVRPSRVLLAVDGPKVGDAKDGELVHASQLAVERIDWPATVDTRFRSSNLGLRNAVADAVSWAVSDFGKVIVFEDDFRPGLGAVDFLQSQLRRFRDEHFVAHINGYNLVPTSRLTNPNHQTRWTRYIESYSWATWERSWKDYDPDLDWAKSVTVSELVEILGTLSGAVRWKLNFNDAAANRIDTWAYRWLATIWKRRKMIVAPNRNLGRYVGHAGGTHTRTPGYKKEPEVNSVSSLAARIESDASADRFLAKSIFGEHFNGVARGIAASVILGALQRQR